MPLAKQNRIVHDKDIKKTYLARFKSRNEMFFTYLRPNIVDRFELLIVVSKKVFKKANLRNRIKRKISAVFIDLHTKKRLPSNISTIIQIKSPKLILLSTEELKKVLIEEVSKLYTLSVQKSQILDKNPRLSRKYSQIQV